MHFENDIPQVATGIEPGRLILSGGRLCAQVAAHGGLTRIAYYGEQRFGDAHLYQNSDGLSAWLQLFRPCLVVDGHLFYLEFTGTELYPFGYASRCTLAGVTVRHELVLLNDALVNRLTVLANPEGRTVAAAMLHMDGSGRIGHPTREWSGLAWQGEGEILLTRATDRHPREQVPPFDPLHSNRFPHGEVEHAETFVAITASTPLRVLNPNPVQKYNIHGEPFTGSCTLVVAFGHGDQARFLSRVRQLRSGAGAEADARLAAHCARLQDGPRLSTNDPAVGSFAAHAAPLMDAMKVADLPGLLRSASYGYWMWGWDSLVHSNAFGLAGDNAFLPMMLDFFARHNDPQLGLFHQIMTNQQPRLSMHWSAQSLFTIALYEAWLSSGDVEPVDRHYALAKTILDRAGADEVAGSGLIRGCGIYPDAVALLDQDGDDIAAINNSLYYQGLRALAELARATGRTADLADLSARAERLRSGFARLFDPEQGFFVDSLSAKDFSQRKHYCVHAIMWVTPFARDLVAGKEAAICRFMTTHLRVRHGFRLMPQWDSRYMADGNNQGYYDPYNERFYREMMKAGRCGEGIRGFLADLSWAWNQLTVPEALSAEAENNGFTLDNVGVALPFTIKAWHATLVNTVVGLDLDAEGLVFAPCDAPDFRLRNLVVRGRRIDLTVSGGGWGIARLTCNGRAIAAPWRIPFAALAERNDIVVERGP